MPNLKKSGIPKKGKLSDYEYHEALEQANQKDFDNKIIPFRIYKTWLLAMITKNKEQMSDSTREVAEALYGFRTTGKESSTKRSNLVQNQLLSAKTKKLFLEALTEIVKNAKEDKLQIFKELRDRVHLMTNEDFGYFVVLLKFDYAYQERIS